MGAHPYQTNFSAGELTKFLWSRTDYRKYPNGMELGENAVIKVTGGASRRAGTQYIARGKGRSCFQPTMVQDEGFQVSATTGARLRKFVFNTNEAYVLEFGDRYIRFYRNREQILGNGDGTELGTNGEFTSDLTGWSLQQDNGATVVWTSPGHATLTPGASGTAGLYQTISGLTPGDTYAVTYEVGGANLSFKVGSTAGDDDLVTQSSSVPGSYRALFVAPSSGSATVYWLTSEAGAVATLDTVTVQLATPLEIETPYLATDVPSLRFAQSADVLYIAHGSYPLRKLTRLSETLWTLQVVTLTPPPTEEVEIEPTAYLTPGATSGTGVTFTTDASSFLLADEGRQIKALGGVAVITAVNSDVNVTADIISDFISTDPIAPGRWSMDGSPFSEISISTGGPVNSPTGAVLTTSGWRSTDVGGFILVNGAILEIYEIVSDTIANTRFLKAMDPIPDTLPEVVQAGAWTLERESFSESLGYPETVAFYEQRLALSKRQTIWMSVVGDFENFAGGVNDDDSVEFLIVGGSNSVDVIRWVKSMKDMLAGTIGSEYRIFGGSESTITPTQILTKDQSAWGSDPTPDAQKAGKAVLFVQRGQTVIREIGFAIEEDGYNAADLTILAEHIFREGIVELEWVSSPDSYILAVLNDGRMACASYNRDEEVVAWTQIRPSGWEYGTSNIRSVCVIPNKCGAGDEIWVLVERDGRANVEVFDGQLNTDAALVYDDDVPADTLVGLSHLEGQEVDVKYTSQAFFQRGAFQQTAFQRVHVNSTTATVSGASVSIAPAQAVRIEVGLPYRTKIKTLPLETPTQQGTAHFRRKRSPTIYVSFLCSQGDGIYVNNENVPKLKVEAEENYYFSKQANLGWDRREQVTVEQRKPFSMTVLGISRNLTIDDGEAP